MLSIASCRDDIQDGKLQEWVDRGIRCVHPNESSSILLPLYSPSQQALNKTSCAFPHILTTFGSGVVPKSGFLLGHSKEIDSVHTEYV